MLLLLLTPMLPLGLWALGHTFCRALWDALLDKAAISQVFADQASLALPLQDQVALGWAVRRAVMADVLYAQVITDGKIVAHRDFPLSLPIPRRGELQGIELPPT